MFTAVAAIAAAFSARAALRTAGKAERHRGVRSRRSAARRNRCCQSVDVAPRSRDPVSSPMRLEVVNHGANRGSVTHAIVRGSDGPVLTVTVPMRQNRLH